MKLNLPLILILLGTRALAADEISVSASADRAQAALNEPFGFVVSVIGADGNIPSPDIPQVPGLVFHAAGRAHNVNIVNGQMTSSVSFNYTVTARIPGRITVPPVSVTVEGRIYKSGPVQVEVSQGPPRASSQELPDVFVTAKADDIRPFVGQQVAYIFRMYARTQFMSQPNLSPPDFAGFIIEKLPVRNFDAMHDGAAYKVSEVRYALFPTAPGRMEIGPAVLRVQVPDRNDRSPFGRFFQTGRGITLSSDPVKLEVRPLPAAGKPADFSGAVGSYRIESSLDHSVVKAGEPATLSVVVSGRGLVKSLPEPDWPEIPGAKRYETVAAVNMDAAGNQIGGSKTFKTVLIPQSSGRIRIPPICLTVFNPQTERYSILRSPTLILAVKPAAAGAESTSPEMRAAGSLKQLQRDIRFLKSEFRVLPAGFQALDRGFIYRQIPPLLFLLTALFARWLRIRARSDPRGARARAASRNARRRLKAALKRAHRGDWLETYMVLQEALANYLADIWGISAAGLTLNEACYRLASGGMDEETIRRVRDLWEQADLIRYAPAATSDSDLVRTVREAGELLRRLERHP